MRSEGGEIPNARESNGSDGRRCLDYGIGSWRAADSEVESGGGGGSRVRARSGGGGEAGDDSCVDCGH